MTDEQATADEQELAAYDLLASEIAGGPGSVMRDLASDRRVRPTNSRLRDMRGPLRLAEIVCSRKRRSLLAVVLGSTGQPLIVTNGEVSEPFGADLLAPCRCGWDHVIDGALLRAEVMGGRKPSGRPQPIAIERVSRDIP